MPSRGLLATTLPLAIVALTVFSSCSTTANISEVWTALDGDGVRRRNVFFTDTNEIHCIAQTGVGRPNVTVEAYIHQIRAYNFEVNDADSADGYFPADRYLGYAEIKPEPKKDGPVLIDLSLGRVGPDGKPKDDEPFTSGSYICEVALDGEIQGTAAFNIDFPPCPPAFIIPNGPCLGFFPNGRVCPQYGILSDDPANCECTRDVGWKCRPE